jgi:hypothetical protein
MMRRTISTIQRHDGNFFGFKRDLSTVVGENTLSFIVRVTYRRISPIFAAALFTFSVSFFPPFAQVMSRNVYCLCASRASQQRESPHNAWTELIIFRFGVAITPELRCLTK